MIRSSKVQNNLNNFSENMKLAGKIDQSSSKLMKRKNKYLN